MKPQKSEFVVRAIIEIAGKPKDYVEKTMKLVVDKLKQEKGIKIKHSKTHGAEQHEDIFSTFADVELEIQDFDTLLFFCFEYTPSSIEFLEPEEVHMDLIKLTEIFNDLLGRLHQTDMKLKNANAAVILLEKNSKALLKNVISIALMDKDRDINELSKAAGIMPEQLKLFLENFVSEKIIKKNGDTYSLRTT